MSFDTLSDLNWLAVIVAAVAYFALGALWYAPPVFGNTWMRSIGWEPSEEERPNIGFYLFPLIANVVMAIAIGMLAKATGTDTFGEGVVLAIVVAIGVGAMLMLITAAFDPKAPRKWTWFGVTGGYHVVGLALTAIIVGSWT